MKANKLILLLFLIPFIAKTQQIHTPMEIVQIMSNSKLSYEIDALNKTIECQDYSSKLNYHDCYRVIKNGELITYRISVSEKAKPVFDKAEDFFSKRELDSALVYYQQSLKIDTTLYNVMTYIGQIYGTKKDYDTAISWYEKVISKNYIDYMAHWFLADLYLHKNELKKAVDEIVIAQILNRNNPRIKDELMTILKNAKIDYSDWCFNPQVEILKKGDNKIGIALSEKWTGYAMAKALWMFEPGYKKSMGIEEGHYSTLEDKECLISELVGLENGKINIKKDPQLLALRNAGDEKCLDQYILYEIVLPQTPAVAYQLPVESILSIKDYILKVRSK